MSTPRHKYTAVIPAGGRFNKTEPQSGITGMYAPVSVKAMARIGESTLLEIVLTVLAQVELVERIVVVGPALLVPDSDKLGAIWADDTGSLLGNVQAGVNAAELSGDDPVLVIAADLAEPKSESITSFLEKSLDTVRLSVPLISKSEFVKAYPGSPSTYVGLKDGHYTVGSQVTAPASLILNPPPAVSALLGNRKSQFQMARALGLGVIWGLLTRSLSVSDLERRITELVGAKASAIRDSGPDLALDIDDEADLKYARSIACHSERGEESRNES